MSKVGVIIPVFADGRDRGYFNDLHQAEELDAVRAQLSAGSHAPPSETLPFLQPSSPKCDARDGTGDTRPLPVHGNALRLLDANTNILKICA